MANLDRAPPWQLLLGQACCKPQEGQGSQSLFASCAVDLLTSGGFQVENELSEICSSILKLLDDHLIPTASSGESKVFYLKMKGDYHRYLAEFKTGTDRKDAAEHTLLAYKAAQVRGLQSRFLLTSLLDNCLRFPSLLPG